MTDEGSEQPPSRRTPWGSITRQQIIDAATKAIRKNGYEQTTIRSLAAEIGVAPMSLYQHVRDKDDLLDEVVDRLLARAWKPRTDPSDWRAWIAEAADKLRRFLVTQPAALHVYLAHPVISPAAVARMEAMMAVLRDWFTDEAAAQRAYAAIHTYTIGFAALEASRAGWRPASLAGWRPTSRAPTRQAAKRLDDRQEAAVAEPDEGSDLAHQLASFTTPEQFASGLHFLLEGLSMGLPS